MPYGTISLPVPIGIRFLTGSFELFTRNLFFHFLPSKLPLLNVWMVRRKNPLNLKTLSFKSL